MQPDEFVKLTPEVLSDLVSRQRPKATKVEPLGKRRESRWPFPGTVELWLPEAGGRERHLLATALNISGNGVGLLCDESIPSGITLSLAVHLPQATYLGKAVVRHVGETPRGYAVGMQFVFED